MNGKSVVSKEARRSRHVFGIERAIRRLTNREKKGKGDYSEKINILAKQAEILIAKSAGCSQLQ